VGLVGCCSSYKVRDGGVKLGWGREGIRVLFFLLAAE